MGNSREWVEQEWWFDAERLHSPSDLSRMRDAAQVVRDEVSLRERREGQVTIDSIVDVKVLERPGNDIGREMEVLLYGRDGGFAHKIDSISEQTASVVQIQCLYGSFSLIRRVRRRREARVLVAAVYIQKLYRRRARLLLSDAANRLAEAAQAHRENYIKEREKRLAVEREKHKAHEQQQRREQAVKRRWAAVRSALKALIARRSSATRLQCMIRARKARETYFHKQLEKRSRMRELRSQGQTIEPRAKMIQARVRAHRSATKKLTEEYDERTMWYNDSRTAVMLAPVSRHITAARRELRITLNKLTPRLTKLANAEEEHLAGVKQLWALEGEISVLEQLMAHPSIDVLMKRRLEFKLAIQTSVHHARPHQGGLPHGARRVLAATVAANKFRGALEVLERLQAQLRDGDGAHRGPRRGAQAQACSQLEVKLEAAARPTPQGAARVPLALGNERGASNALALCSSFLSRHATAAPIVRCPDGEVH